MVRLTIERALCPRPRVSVSSTSSIGTVETALIATTDRTQRRRVDGQHHPAARAVHEPPDAEAEERAHERRPQVDLRVGHAVEPQVGEQRLGDEAESLRAAGQRPDHGERRHRQVHPAVVHRPALTPNGRGSVSTAVVMRPLRPPRSTYHRCRDTFTRAPVRSWRSSRLPALAQDTWLAATARVEPRSLLRMELTSGDAFPDLEHPIEADRLATSACRIGGQDVAMGVGPRWQYALRLRAWMAEPGIAICRVALGRARSTSPDEVATSDGDRRHGAVGPPGGARAGARPTRSTRRRSCAWATPTSPGASRSAWGSRSCRSPIPTRLRAGDALAVRVLEEGRPLAGLALRAVTRGRRAGLRHDRRERRGDDPALRRRALADRGHRAAAAQPGARQASGRATSRRSRSTSRADPLGAALVEHDAPLPVLLAPPDRVERAACSSRPAASPGPELIASVPESSTSTVSGSQENGAAGCSKSGFQSAATAALPCVAPARPKNTASSARNVWNAA